MAILEPLVDTRNGAPRHIVITADGTTAVVANELGFVQFIR